MREFAEKLIGRLKEESELLLGGFGSIHYSVRAIQIHKVEDVVNQVTEEFKEKDCSKCSRRSWYQKGYDDAERNNSWIYCSERLPNKEEYLVNDGRFIVTDGNRCYQSIWDIYFHRFRTAKLFDMGKSRFEVDNCVIAWQPLPDAPYKILNSNEEHKDEEL